MNSLASDKPEDYSLPQPYRAPHATRRREYAYRDAHFLTEESNLDYLIETGQPKKALPLETAILQEVSTTPYIPEGLARLALKVVATAHAARQFYSLSPERHPDTTYRSIGMLLEKTLTAQRQTDYSSRERRLYTGTLSEISFFALAAFNASLTEPLSGKAASSARPRYVLPTTFEEDVGPIRLDGSIHSSRKTGYDFKITYVEGDDPDRYIQVKTSRANYHKADYVPRVRVVALSDLQTAQRTPQPTIVEALIRDAQGQADNASHQVLHNAARKLNQRIK